MYTTIMKFKDTISEEEFLKLKSEVEKEFDTKIGKLDCSLISSRTLRNDVMWKDWKIQNLAMMNIYRNRALYEKLERWEYIDENPAESCDMIEVCNKVYNRTHGKKSDDKL